jgi:hypothetical protein
MGDPWATSITWPGVHNPTWNPDKSVSSPANLYSVPVELRLSPLINKQLHSREIEAFLLSGRVNRAYCSPGWWIINRFIVFSDVSLALLFRGSCKIWLWYGHSVSQPSMTSSDEPAPWEVKELGARCLLARAISIPLLLGPGDASRCFCFFAASDWFSLSVESRGWWLLIISKAVSSNNATGRIRHWGKN